MSIDDHANALLRTRLLSSRQRLVVTDELGMTHWRPEAAELYELTAENSRRCQECLLAYQPISGRGGKQQRFCSTRCSRAHARGGNAGWLNCDECGLDFYTRDPRRKLHPRPWPQGFRGSSPCTEAHRRKLVALNTQQWRQRQMAVAA